MNKLKQISEERLYGLWFITGIHALLVLFVLYDVIISPSNLSYLSVLVWGVILWALFVKKANWSRIIFLVLAWLKILGGIGGSIYLAANFELANWIEYLFIAITFIILPCSLDAFIIYYLSRKDIKSLYVKPKIKLAPLDESTSCPKCSQPLRTALAKQCPHCLSDWH